MRKPWIFGSVAAIVGAALIGWWVYGTSHYRYKLTVEVETPSGLRTGSAVHEIAASENVIKLVDGDKAWVSFRGEAFPVDLGNGKTLFVLVASSDSSEESLIPAVQSALDPEYRPGGLGNLASVKKMARSIGNKRAALAPTWKVMGEDRPYYPLLVRFEDERDPKTVEEVKPFELAGAFGLGYRLRGMTVETTSEDVTEGILRRLPWLMEDGRPREVPLSGENMRTRGNRELRFSDKIGFRSFKRKHIVDRAGIITSQLLGGSSWRLTALANGSSFKRFPA